MGNNNINAAHITECSREDIANCLSPEQLSKIQIGWVGIFHAVYKNPALVYLMENRIHHDYNEYNEYHILGSIIKNPAGISLYKKIKCIDLEFFRNRTYATSCNNGSISFCTDYNIDRDIHILHKIDICVDLIKRLVVLYVNKAKESIKHSMDIIPFHKYLFSVFGTEMQDCTFIDFINMTEVLDIIIKYTKNSDNYNVFLFGSNRYLSRKHYKEIFNYIDQGNSLSNLQSNPSIIRILETQFYEKTPIDIFHNLSVFY
jgi:hypothetical protein